MISDMQSVLPQLQWYKNNKQETEVGSEKQNVKDPKIQQLIVHENCSFCCKVGSMSLMMK